MKGALIIIVLSLSVSPVLAELTKKDLQAIETIIEKSEGRTKEYIDSKYLIFVQTSKGFIDPSKATQSSAGA